MDPKRIALINIGSNDQENTVGRGPIFSDGTFKYIPIPEDSDIKNIDFRFPNYTDLGIESYIDNEFRDLFVHNDPDFINMTYGHVQRGFGYEKILKQLEFSDILAFYSTLKYNNINSESRRKWINKDWGTYIIGAFSINGVYTQKEFVQLPFSIRKRFMNNPHYLRKEPKADLWIAGHQNKLGLFKIAFPLDTTENLPNEFLSNNFQTSAKNKPPEKGYYRTAFKSKSNASELIRTILNHSKLNNSCNKT